MSTSRYGDVAVSIDGKGYTVRVGTMEFYKLEQVFGVVGIGNVITAWQEGGAAGDLKLFAVALSSNHPDLTERQVADLIDYHEDGKQPLVLAVREALRFSVPKLFADEEADPKAETATTSLISE